MIYIQIEDAEPFVPDEVGEIGNVFGTNEVTSEHDKVRNYKITSCIAVLDYVKDDRSFKDYYNNGKWTTTADGKPLFKVSGLLGFDTKSAEAKQ